MGTQTNGGLGIFPICGSRIRSIAQCELLPAESWAPLLITITTRVHLPPSAASIAALVGSDASRASNIGLMDALARQVLMAVV